MMFSFSLRRIILISRLDAALTYARDFNWYVFPVPAGTRASHKNQEQYGTPWGQTNDPCEILQDWSQWPNANIGLPCGQQNGVFVVDVDTKDGHSSNGFIALSRLET